MNKIWALLLLLAVRGLAKDSCVECHSALEGNLKTPVTNIQTDIHTRSGFGCVDCHGGDQSVDDPYQSMSRSRGFTGHVARTAIPKLCARCHSNATLMHKFKPQQSVDQFALYQTSTHGKRLAAGDEAVATCIDCHSVHDIRQVRDSLSPVHPLRLPETCAGCHANAQYMAAYRISTNQFAEYRASVHWETLAKRGDLSAPTCASCHGNHGATPPHVSSVAAVCGSCHALVAQIYEKSPHQLMFASMGGARCNICHGNHEIRRPSVDMLAGSSSVCTQCHDAASTGGIVATEMARSINELGGTISRSDVILSRARNSGMEVSEAQLRQIEAREALVKARVAVHSLQLPPVTKAVGEGLAIARANYAAGETALQERNRRRIGLGVSLLSIVITMAGLWLAIRSIEGKSQPAGELSGEKL